MKFWKPLQRGTIIKRYKRFFVDVELETGSCVSAHCVNTGAMLGLAQSGAKVWVCPKKAHSTGKLPFVWMMEEVQKPKETVFVGVNTQMPNVLVKEALLQKQFPQWSSVSTVQNEPRLGVSRLDILLSLTDLSCIWIEIKNVHLNHENTALFPDCVSQRGTKHLHLLTELAHQGKNAAMVYVVQRNDCSAFQVAGCIDLEYGKAFEKAQNAGVMIWAYGCTLSLDGIVLNPVPLEIQGVRWTPLKNI